MEKVVFEPSKDYDKAIKVVENTKKLLIYEDEFFENFEGFEEFSPLFRFSNENISEYYKLYNFKNKDVLTVIGSGDQALSASYKGAKKVDVFDINKLSYYLLILKKYAAIYLSYDEFIAFFNPSTNLKKVDLLYKKISSQLEDENVKTFWNLIFQNSYYFYFLFLDTNISVNRIKKNIPYLENEYEYDKLKKSLPNYNFNYIGGDIQKIVESTKNKYDYVNLSNIIDYIDDKELAKKIYVKIFKYLISKDGMCMVEYEWFLYACCNKYIMDLFSKYKIDKYSMEKECNRSSNAYIYKK